MVHKETQDTKKSTDIVAKAENSDTGEEEKEEEGRL
jgi:hypothetical protein